MKDNTEKSKILLHLHSLLKNLPDFIKLIEEAPEDKNGDAFIEVIWKSRDMDYWIQHHLNNKKKG